MPDGKKIDELFSHLPPDSAIQPCPVASGAIERPADGDLTVASPSAGEVPPVPDKIIGDQSSPLAGRTSSGNRHTSGALTPANGGRGDANQDFDFLTGGTGRPFPPDDSRSKIPGALIGDNGVWIRPEGKDGPRIEIPANGDKIPETLHYLN